MRYATAYSCMTARDGCSPSSATISKPSVADVTVTGSVELGCSSLEYHATGSSANGGSSGLMSAMSSTMACGVLARRADVRVLRLLLRRAGTLASSEPS